MAFNFGSIVGYTLSGLLIQFASWRYIFLMNIPIGLFGTSWAHLRLREMHRARAKHIKFHELLEVEKGFQK
jgi:MFS family permease